MAKSDDTTTQKYKDFARDLMWELQEARAVLAGASSMYNEYVDADTSESLTHISYLYGVIDKKLESTIRQLDESAVSDFA